MKKKRLQKHKEAKIQGLNQFKKLGNKNSYTNNAYKDLEMMIQVKTNQWLKVLDWKQKQIG